MAGDACAGGGKFFEEVNLHYDRRFFRRTLEEEALLAGLRSLFGAFSALMTAGRVDFFLMHGTLLGWYWNRRILPWDNDIDVSVFMEGMGRLAALAAERTAREGRHLLEVNPDWENRDSRNLLPSEGREPNRIDARFIDRETALFIDITAFADAGGGMVKSKCPHVFRLADLLPLRRDTFEGETAFVPRNVLALLHQKYGPASTTRVEYDGYRWDAAAALWRRKGRREGGASVAAEPSGGPSQIPFHCLQRYRRTVATWPHWKRLIPVADERQAPLPFGDEPGMLCPEVIFSRLEDPGTGRLIWGKKYLPPQDRQLPLELELYGEIARTGLSRVLLPLGVHEQFGLLFPYDDELFTGRVVHLCNAPQFFHSGELMEVGVMGRTTVDHPSLGRRTLAELADFQAVRTSRGLVFLDFTIRPEFW